MSSSLSLLMKMYGCSPLFFYTKTDSRDNPSQIPNRVRIMNQVYGDYVDQYYFDKKNQFRIKPDPSYKVLRASFCNFVFACTNLTREVCSQQARILFSIAKYSLRIW